MFRPFRPRGRNPLEASFQEAQAFDQELRARGVPPLYAMIRNVRSATSSMLAIAGSAASALASLCCTIPALSTAIVAVLGVGGSVMLASLAPYRPWLMLGSAILLAFAIYNSFKRSCARAARIISLVGVATWLISLYLWITIH
jgi:hypothetical protein